MKEKMRWIYAQIPFVVVISFAAVIRSSFMLKSFDYTPSSVTSEKKTAMNLSNAVIGGINNLQLNTSVPSQPQNRIVPSSGQDQNKSFSTDCAISNILLSEQECQQNYGDTPKVQINVTSLARELECERLRDRMGNQSKKTVNFLAAAHSKHTGFLPTYAFFALSYNSNSTVEIIVQNRIEFIETHARALWWLGNSGFVLCVRNFHADPSRLNRTIYNTWRFLEVPVLRHQSDYTYIGDVDLLITEPVVEPLRLEQMARLGLPYSNIVRKNSFKNGIGQMTGLMLMNTEEYYTPTLVKAQQTIPVQGNDERFLYRLINKAGLGLPPRNHTEFRNSSSFDPLTYRPVHGLHLSLNRGPFKAMCLQDWQGDNSRGLWCKVLGTPLLQEFWCQDHIGHQLMEDMVRRVKKQIQGNFRIQKRKCRPSKNKI